MSAAAPETQETATSTPSIAGCLGKLVETLGGENPNSNDICENIDALCNCYFGSGGQVVVYFMDGSGGIESNMTFNEIALEIDGGKTVVAKYSGHCFNLSAFTNTTGSKLCTFNGIVVDGANAIVHTLNITPTTITHTTTRLTVSS